MNEEWLLILGGAVVAFLAWRMVLAGRSGKRPSAADGATEEAARRETERLAAEEAARRAAERLAAEEAARRE
ncbi:hypothetical protein, partial [Accumulibacter sp.]|uniref:hypothetical protein n=1 Tax=Accumulibacter sp. TaxID=2053492 RepID=UPI002D1FB5A3